MTGKSVRDRSHVVELDVRADQLPRDPVDHVACERHVIPVQLPGLKSSQRARPVVAAGHRLYKQPASGRCGRAHRDGQLWREWTGTVDDFLDQLACIRSLGLTGQRRDLPLDLGIHPLPSLHDHGLVEVAEADLASQVGDDRVSALERDREPVESLSELRADVPDELIGILESPVEDRHDRRARDLGALLGEEQPVAGLLQSGGPLEAVDPVVDQRPLQRGDEPRRQSLGVGVKRAQPGVQVLLRTLEGFRTRLLVSVVGTRDRTQVGEHPQ